MTPSAPLGAFAGFATAALFCLWAGRPAAAQTPSPLQEWQYSSGVPLYKLFEPDMPDWQVQSGAAFESRPLYEGAVTYRELGGPVVDVRYRDLYFISSGEGIGYNFMRAANYRAGISLGYDLGRYADQDLDHLKGLGNVSAAPVIKLFGSYVISKAFPLVLRVDLRQYVGGANGLAGDVEAYLPLPGSSERFVMFAGPSFTFADRLHMQTLFGISPDQSLASGYPDYLAHGGADSAGFGFSATRFLGKHWLLHLDLAADRLLGSAALSPITQRTGQDAGVLAVAYRW